MDVSIFLNGQNCEQIIYHKEDEFEKFILDNAETIFGTNSIYIDIKHRIENSSLGGTIPDGVLINLSDLENPQFYIVEVELQNHDFRSHIYPQIDKFFDFFSNIHERNKLTEKIDSIIRRDDSLQSKLKKLIGQKEIYRFLKDTLENSQNILIVINGYKHEIEEKMNNRLDTWGKWVKVQIINHFQNENQNIILANPPSQNLEFGDAVESATAMQSVDSSQYSEEFHLKDCNENVNDIYNKLKKSFLKIKNTLTFNPVKYYIGVRDIKNIAAIRFRKRKLLVEFDLSEDEVNLESKHHKIRLYSSRGPMVEIDDTNYWDEIQKLIVKLVERHQDT